MDLHLPAELRDMAPLEKASESGGFLASLLGGPLVVASLEVWETAFDCVEAASFYHEVGVEWASLRRSFTRGSMMVW